MDIREFRSERRKQRFRFWNFVLGTVVLGLIGYFIQWKQIRIEEEISDRQLQIEYFDTFLPHYLDASKSGVERQIVLLTYMEIMSDGDYKLKYRQLLDSALQKRILYRRLDSLSEAAVRNEVLRRQGQHELSVSNSENENLVSRIKELEERNRQIQREKNNIESRLTIAVPLLTPYGINKYWVNKLDSIIIRISIQDTVQFNESLSLTVTSGGSSGLNIESNYSGPFDARSNGSVSLLDGRLSLGKELKLAKVPNGVWYVTYVSSAPRKVTLNDNDILFDGARLTLGDFYFLKIRRE